MKSNCKVFCKHCKYFKLSDAESMYGYHSNLCNHPSNITFSQNSYGIRKDFQNFPDGINAANNCPNYKQKLTFAALKDNYTNKKALKKILLDKTLDKMQGTYKSVGLNPDSGMYIEPDKIESLINKMSEIQLKMQKMGFIPSKTGEPKKWERKKS